MSSFRGSLLAGGLPVASPRAVPAPRASTTRVSVVDFEPEGAPVERARKRANRVLAKTRLVTDDERAMMLRDLAIAVHDLADHIEALERA